MPLLGIDTSRWAGLAGRDALMRALCYMAGIADANGKIFASPAANIT